MLERYPTLLALGLCACAVDNGVSEADPRGWNLAIESEVEAQSITSEIDHDGRLVAIATLTTEACVVTLAPSGIEVVGAPPAYDAHARLDRYEQMVVNVSTALLLSESPMAMRSYVPEMNAEQSAFRRLDACDVIDFPFDGGYCVASWCAPGCFAMDCEEADGFESHFAASCDSLTGGSSSGYEFAASPSTRTRSP